MKCKKLLESLVSQSLSLTLSNIDKLYLKYVHKNLEKIKSDLNRVGYFIIKNKVSLGKDKNTEKNIFINVCILNKKKAEECNRMIKHEYNSDIDIETSRLNGWAYNNEIICLVIISDIENIEKEFNKYELRSTIEHELIHAIDCTRKKTSKMDVTSHTPTLVEAGLPKGCYALDIISYDELKKFFEELEYILSDSDELRQETYKSISSIEFILYLLFDILENNAHQTLRKRGNEEFDYKKIKIFLKVLKDDVTEDYKLRKDLIKRAMRLHYKEFPMIWELVGKLLSGIGFKLKENSPKYVYNYFYKISLRLLDEFINKKTKNQSKAFSSIKEKESIKQKVIKCIREGTIDKGVSFWFSPTGKSDSFICRIRVVNNELIVTVNKKPIKIYGNADLIIKQALETKRGKEREKIEFLINKFVDIVIQSIERNFKNSSDKDYEPIYDITFPQDTFDDLDYDN